MRKPTIVNFMPIAVAPGAAVTLVGTDLNLVPGSTTVSVGGAPVTVTSVSNSQLFFNAPTASGSGPIQITTSYGVSTSASHLMMAPSHTAPNVVAAASGSVDQQFRSATVGHDALNRQISVQRGGATEPGHDPIRPSHRVWLQQRTHQRDHRQWGFPAEQCAVRTVRPDAGLDLGERNVCRARVRSGWARFGHRQRGTVELRVFPRRHDQFLGE
ncbi:IPT/TIG domain-containing protein [Peristeroidobacter agariperforans]|uniref:IPT/TIG domain-containing protein n=1 Tax=Peristeroidobacter agariperforans TaxID=268404 RepID=UPI00101CD95F